MRTHHRPLRLALAQWLPRLAAAVVLVSVGALVGTLSSSHRSATAGASWPLAARPGLGRAPGSPARAAATGPGPLAAPPAPPHDQEGPSEQQQQQQQQFTDGQAGGGGSGRARPVPPPGSVTGRHEWPIAHGERYSNLWKGWISSQWNETVHGPIGRWPTSHTLRWGDVRPGFGFCDFRFWRSPVFELDDTERLRGWPESAMVTEGGLFVDERGELFFEPADCNLYRHTAPQARSCLANKTIAVIGDSISRYHFLSLSDFLVHGRYEQRYGDDASRPSLTGHQINAWGGWNSFFNGSTERLTVKGAELNSTMGCDCMRDGAVGPDTRENRDLNITLEDGTTIRMVYRQVLKWPSSPVRTAQELQHVVSGMARAPDIVIVNIFAWLPRGRVIREEYKLATDVFLPLFQLGRQLMAEHPGLVLVWRTPMAVVPPTIWKEQMREVALLYALASWHGWRILSADAVTMPAMRQDLNIWAPDGLHLMPFMYEQVNDVLFNLLCPLPEET